VPLLDAGANRLRQMRLQSLSSGGEGLLNVGTHWASTSNDFMRSRASVGTRRQWVYNGCNGPSASVGKREKGIHNVGDSGTENARPSSSSNTLNTPAALGSTAICSCPGAGLEVPKTGLLLASSARQVCRHEMKRVGYVDPCALQSLSRVSPSRLLWKPDITKCLPRQSQGLMEHHHAAISLHHVRHHQLQLCQKTENPELVRATDAVPRRRALSESQRADVATPGAPSATSKTTNADGGQALPVHIGVIMDGNGRWGVRAHGSRSAGHDQGIHALRGLIEDCLQWRIPYLTVFAFSTENWRRPSTEVTYLFTLFHRIVDDELAKWHARGVRVVFVGERDALPESLRRKMTEAEQRTAHNRTLCLQVALNYSGRQDIVRAARRMALDVEDGRLDPRRIDEAVFAYYLAECWGIDVPDPDLIIRTGGEQRLSNFMLWQVAYAEIYVTSTLWPEFTSIDFARALDAFHERRRRFGGVAGQRSRPGITDDTDR
jgi:undecaprenyl diphosphate synthase